MKRTEECSHHIVNSHDDFAGYYDDCLHVIEEPDLVLSGTRGSLKAVKGYGRNRYLIAPFPDNAESHRIWNLPVGDHLID